MSTFYHRLLHLVSLSIVSIGLLAIPAGQAFAQTGTRRSTSTGESIFTGTFLLCILGMYALIIFFMFWVYNDANERGTNGCLWVLLVFFLGIPGIILYFLLRPKPPTLAPCPHCGQMRSPHQPYCPYCGQPQYVFHEKPKRV